MFRMLLQLNFTFSFLFLSWIVYCSTLKKEMFSYWHMFSSTACCLHLLPILRLPPRIAGIFHSIFISSHNSAISWLCKSHSLGLNASLQLTWSHKHLNISLYLLMSWNVWENSKFHNYLFLLNRGGCYFLNRIMVFW